MRAAGQLCGKKPKRSIPLENDLVALHRAGMHATSEIAEVLGVARSTVYRAIQGGRSNYLLMTRSEARTPTPSAAAYTGVSRPGGGAGVSQDVGTTTAALPRADGEPETQEQALTESRGDGSPAPPRWGR
ncbi:helix-turn-helix domain-containing protein [Curtobacterium sp. MCPF17_002]|uniref:helix-turn-helix domain-containing protein n=1 Tax=Curtobacterium sp. MCPF17_002 TaxID=2175645 RepID=UPI0021AC4C4A|nr:helix-turn-helix domain-containing protein [Curtobacterium sp. MCPF17_002]WIB77980.1 helix-turn-helix domain-containing protein [Curtobacterium sp. MCPF17_002]